MLTFPSFINRRENCSIHFSHDDNSDDSFGMRGSARACLSISMSHKVHSVFAIVVSHHGTDHPAEVDRVCSSEVVSVLVTEVLWADL